jgi:ATP-binding cassette subfamily F protein 3
MLSPNRTALSTNNLVSRGQTTLVKVILGELEATAGAVRRNPHCRVAMVNQHHADQIDLSLTPLAFMKRKFPGDGSMEHDQRVRSHLASCGVSAKLMMTQALALSGGQRSRVRPK